MQVRIPKLACISAAMPASTLAQASAAAACSARASAAAMPSSLSRSHALVRSRSSHARAWRARRCKLTVAHACGHMMTMIAGQHIPATAHALIIATSHLKHRVLILVGLNHADAGHANLCWRLQLPISA